MRLRPTTPAPAAFCVSLCTVLFFTAALRADVKLSPLFADHMVVQRGIPVPVWGTADPGEAVAVSLGGPKVTATADASGKWLVKVPPLDVGPAREMTVVGRNADRPLTVKDVLVGEVWVCSGQSNMEWNVNNSNQPEKERAEAANYPQVRMFTVKKAVTGKPSATLEGSWAVSAPGSVGNFSAVGYFFGRELHKSLGVPVGLIHTSWGGTPAESWTSAQALAADDDLKPILERWNQQYSAFRRQLAELPQSFGQWAAAAEQAEAQGRPVPAAPKVDDPRSSPWRPSGLYNAMIAPVLPYGIKGAIWYQGESNAGRAYQYRKLLPAMIKSWRDAWGQGDFSFLIVSLANYQKVDEQPVESEWAELREAQAIAAAKDPNNGLALAIDIGEAGDIHPRNKQDVGRRLALAALAKSYKQDVSHSGPVFESMTVEGDKVRLKFRHAYDGLSAKGGEGVKGFAVAGEDRKWAWAEAKVDGSDTVVVRSDKVSKPVAVRYAWANNPVCNLYNKADLPAVPFRTDDWKGVTADNK